MPVMRIADFDTWRPGYGLATVYVYKAGTNVLADIYTDEALSSAAANPQTLLEKSIDGVSYGKWAQTIYTEQAVELNINSVDQTGVIRPPLTSVSGIDLSTGVVTPTGATEGTPLATMLARQIHARDYGDFLAVGETGASSATNTTTLTAAIGAAAALGGGLVMLPSGVFQINSVSIPVGVVLVGLGRGVTTLQSTLASRVVTLTGNRAGMSRLTLDGVSQAGSSIGVYAVGKNETFLEDVEIKRFETGLVFKGGEQNAWANLFVSDCVTGAKLRGDLDSGDSTAGGPFRDNTWAGGKVDFCTTAGIQLEYVDAACGFNDFADIVFDQNTGDGMQIIGARATNLISCAFTGNTGNLSVEDDAPATEDNTVISLLVEEGRMSGGTLDLAGNLEDVIFRRVDFSDVDITLTTPTFNVLAIDCREDADVSLAGVATAWQRRKSIEEGASSGLTTGNAATKAWGLDLEPGQRVYLEAVVIGRQRNGTNDGFYHIAVSAHRPPATLAYDTQTANFTVGDVVTGATSGARGRIVADSDSGATGTLSLQDVEGAFIDDEIITDTSGGSATANGTLSLSNAALKGTVAAIRAAQETDADWDATFVANGPEIEVQVTGDASQTVEWTVHVKVVSS